MSHRIQVTDQRVGGAQIAIMRHAFWAVAVIALVYALVVLFAHQYTQFAILIALFGVAVGIDLRAHRRGRYRDRSAVLLLIAAVSIVVAGVFAQVGMTA